MVTLRPMPCTTAFSMISSRTWKKASSCGQYSGPNYIVTQLTRTTRAFSSLQRHGVVRFAAAGFAPASAVRHLYLSSPACSKSRALDLVRIFYFLSQLVGILQYSDIYFNRTLLYQSSKYQPQNVMPKATYRNMLPNHPPPLQKPPNLDMERASKAQR